MFSFMDTNDYVVVINKFEINEDVLSGRITQIDAKTPCHIVNVLTHKIISGSTPIKYFNKIVTSAVLVPENQYGKYLLKNNVEETVKSAPTADIIDLTNKSEGTFTLPNSTKTNSLPREFSGTSPKRAF